MGEKSTVNEIPCKAQTIKTNGSLPFSRLVNFAPPKYDFPKCNFTKDPNPSKKRTIKIMHQNAQYITNKRLMFECILEECEPTVMCISEHGLKDHEISNLIFPGYNNISNFCRTKYKSGGALIIAKNNVKCKRYTKIKSDINQQKVFEITACYLKYEEFSMVIICIYRSPSGNVDDFLNSLYEALASVDPSERIVLVGDFNIDLAPDVDGRYAEKLIDTVNSIGLKQTIFEYTRITESSATTVDNIFTNLDDKLFQAGVVELAVSDHAGQEIVISFEKKHHCSDNSKTSNSYFVREYDPYNLCLFKTELTDLRFKKEMNFKTFYYFLQDRNNRYLPVKEKIMKLTQKIYDQSINEQRKTMRRLACLKIKNRENTETYAEYARQLKISKQKCKKLIAEAKAKQIGHCIANSSNISKTSWKIINSSRQQCNRDDIEKIVHNGREIEDVTGIANTLNEFFVTSVNDTHVNYSYDVEKFKYISYPKNNFSITEASTDEVKGIIMQLKNSKSEASDSLSNTLLKNLINEISPYLTHFINKSIHSGEYPEELKVTKIIPLYKKNEKTNPINYRPLALVSPIAKVFENVIHKQLYRYCEANNLIYKYQYGFRKKRNTEMAVEQCIKLLSSNNDSAMTTVLVAIDLSKAFDLVHHDVLLHKLKLLGLDEIAINWFTSYLKGRKQYVNCKKTKFKVNSRIRVIIYGVPQGSVLGPLLFIVFINDIHQFIVHKLKDTSITFHLILYADDVLLLITHKDEMTLEINTYVVLNLFWQWCQINGMNINIPKTEYMLIKNNPNVDIHLTVKLNIMLECVECINYLGFKLDQNLKYSEHINYLVKKLNSTIFVLRYMAQFCDRKILLLIYHSLFFSHIRYGFLVWSNCDTNSMKRVFSLQKKAIKIIFNVKRDESCKNVFMANELITVPSLKIANDAIKFFSLKHTLQRNNDVHSYQTRNREAIRTVDGRRKENKEIFMSQKIFNKLPEDIKKIKNPIIFKNEIMKFFSKGGFYSKEEFLG